MDTRDQFQLRVGICSYQPEVGYVKLLKKTKKTKTKRTIEILGQPTFWYFREQNVSAILVKFDRSRFLLHNV